MKNSIISLLILNLFFASPIFASTNEEMKKECGNKAILYNMRGVKIGYELRGYCPGYLKGVLETLIVTDSKVCKKRAGSVSPEFLLSIYETYMADKNIKESEKANMTIINAFRRAFLCE